MGRFLRSTRGPPNPVAGARSAAGEATAATEGLTAGTYITIFSYSHTSGTDPGPLPARRRNAIRSGGGGPGVLVASGAVRADGPLSLGEAMSRARDGAREVTAAKARQEAATARARQAAAFRLPSLTLSETYIRTDSPAESFALKMNRKEFSFPDFVGERPERPRLVGDGDHARSRRWSRSSRAASSPARIAQARSAAEAAGSQALWAADNAALAAGEAWVMLAQAEEFVSLLDEGARHREGPRRAREELRRAGDARPLRAPPGRGGAGARRGPARGREGEGPRREREPRLPDRRRAGLDLAARAPPRARGPSTATPPPGSPRPPPGRTSPRRGASSGPASSRRR